MKNKLGSIFFIILLILSSIQLINLNEPNILAYADEEENGDNYLDFEYLWNTTTYLANIIHDDSVYGPGEIKKGRYFGSDGDLAASVHLNTSFVIDCGFDESDVRKVQLKNIPGHPLVDYSELVEVTSYNLTINHPQFLEQTQLIHSTIPQDDCYPIVAVRKNYTAPLNNYTMKKNFNHIHVINETYFKEQYTGWDTGINSYNLTYDPLNDNDVIIGNVTYVAPEDEVPEHDLETVFLFDEVEGCDSQIENATNASGIILLKDKSRGSYNFSNAYHYCVPIMRVNTTDEGNNPNISSVKQLLVNKSRVIADNTLYLNKITFVYNLSLSSCGPDSDWMLIYKFSSGVVNISKHCRKVYNRNYLRLALNKSVCQGIIIYDDLTIDCHNMFPQSIKSLRMSGRIYPMFALPGFSVNNTIGAFLWNHSSDEIYNNISGHVYQIHHQETFTEPGVEAYNVEADLHIDHSLDDQIVLLSSRYDALWGECPGDSGAGVGIIMGIAKYMQQLNQTYDIKPNYNVTFLMTTNEENGMYGAQFYSDSHPNDKIKMWIGIDQLGFKSGSLHNVYKNSTHRNITENISKLLDYVGKTGYNMSHEETPLIYSPWGSGTEDVVFYDRENCDTILIHKDDVWPFHHRRGLNLTDGDVLDPAVFDRKDVNMFYNITWATVKYFLYAPDCWFDGITYETYDSNGGSEHDTLKATYTVKSTLPSDLVMLEATLKSAHMDITYSTKTINFTVNRSGVEKELIFIMPDNDIKGEYKIEFKLYNSTGRINDIVGIGSDNYNQTVTSPHFYLHRWDSFGSNREGDSDTTVTNSIKGSDFRKKGYGTANNITAYIYGSLDPDDRPTYRCMIYNQSDGQLIGTTEEKKPGTIGWTVFTFSDPKPILYNDNQYTLVIWGKNTTTLDYYSGSELIGHSLLMPYGTPPNPPPDPIEFDATDTTVYSLFCSYTPENYLPEITNVSHNPNIMGFGGNVTIIADVTDNLSGVDYVKVNITYPQHGPPLYYPPTTGNFTMTHVQGNRYQYIFNGTWITGQYNYTIWAYDNSSNGNHSSEHHFHVSANATISIQTLVNTYYSGEYVNLTDPPGDEEENTVDYFGDINVPETLHLIITEDANMITVDTRDGLTWKFHKRTTGYNEIWHNGTRLIDEEQWILQNLQHGEWMPSGTPQQVIVEQPEPYHTVVKRIYSNHMGTDFTISYEFYGQSRTKIKFEGTIGEMNNYRLIWNVSRINTDFIESNTNDHYTTIWNMGEQGFVFDYSDVYRNLGDITTVETQNTQDGYMVDQTFNLGILAPGHYTLDPTFGYTTQGGSGLSIGNSIRGSWFTCTSDGVATNIKAYITHSGLGGGSTNGKCAIYQYNADNDATDLIGETNQISLSGAGWKTFTFTNRPTLTAGTKYFLVAWASTSTLITDNLAYTTETSKGIAKTSTTYGAWPDPLTGETGVSHKYSIYCTYNASPVLSGPYPTDNAEEIPRYPTINITVNDAENDTMNLTFSSNATGSWQPFGSVHPGEDNEFGYNHNSSNDGDNVCDMIRGSWFTCPANGSAASIMMYTILCRGPNQQFPTHGKAALYYRSNNTKVAETEEQGYYGMLPGDSYPEWVEYLFTTPPVLHAGVEYYALFWGDAEHSLYSAHLPDLNRSISVTRTYGTWPDTLTDVNSISGKIYDIYVTYTTTSTSNGTYYMDNFDMNHSYTRYYWNVSSFDGTSTTNSNIYRFRTAGNQSKINNTWTTNISGYLVMQVQFYNTTLSTWVVADDTINETTPRTILVGQQLALDHIFNGLVSTSDLITEFGSGTYRVYAAFRDPDGDVLMCSDETELEATWEFTIT